MVLIMSKRFSSFKYLFREGMRNTWVNRLMSLASIGVLGACLLLVGAAGLVTININSISGWVDNQNVIKVFLKMDVDKGKSNAIGMEIMNLSNIHSCEFVSKEDALADLFQNSDKDLQVVQDLMEDDTNPLPDAYRVTVKDLAQYDVTLERIKTIDGVDTVGEKREFAAKLTKIKTLLNVGGLVFVSLFFIVSLFIITNTIRLTMYARKLEMSIMKSVGATNWFIRFPFMVEGMILGFVAAIISFFLLWGGYDLIISLLSKSLNSLAFIKFGQVWTWLIGSLVLMGILIGSFGSAISMGKYLRREGGVYRD
jgi:cell division transport system permease protein